MKHKPSMMAMAAIAVLALLSWLLARDGTARPAAASGQPAAGAHMTRAMWAGLDQQASAPSSPRDQLMAQWMAARQRLESYRSATCYPPESQPIAAHADMLKPFDPVVEDRPALSAQGTAVNGRHLVTSQDRVYVSGTDSVILTVAMRDDQNLPAPLRVIRATAHEVQDVAHPQTVSAVPMQFDDRGTRGDALAGDGIYSAQLQPAAQGFGATQGTVRVELDVQSDTGGAAHTFFDIVYMPNVPATWTGGVREAMNQGSLDFYLKADVREAGRYVVTARAYDATGKPFALLSFNDELPAGGNEVRLTLFGKLARDAKPVFPITLRDIEGFVLYENRFPDRAMMPRWPQAAYTSGMHALGDFADTEWTSDQRQRYLTEYGKDVQVAEQNLQRLAP
ncbi:MAG: hypothetical protein QM749_10480 [Aquabacterium sp.]